MDKTNLRNKAIQDILEDAKDGVLKSKNKQKAKDLVEEINKKVEAKGFKYRGSIYPTLHDVPLPLTQAMSHLACGKIEEIK